MEERGTGVCQRLFSFFLNPLSARAYKPDQTTMGNPTPSCPSSNIPIPIEGSSRNGLSPEVAVEYGHEVGWFNDPTRYNIWGRRRQRNTTPPSVNNVSCEEKNNISALVAEAPITDTTNPPPPRRPRLLSVASNINEKAESFIRRRREKMSRNYSLDLKKF